MDFKALTIKKASEGLEKKEFSAVELAQESIKSIEADTLNAFVSFDESFAIAHAEKADRTIADGKQTPLTGVPFGAKDAICTKDMRSTGAATILDKYVPAHNATAIDRLQSAGAVLVGKHNCDSFGHGASNENSMYGPVKNPHDESRVAGGSSGGSAAAVAAGHNIFSIGEDTGGSIRFPASLCGIVGMRPSYGRNSRYGIMPMASSLDAVGPMGKTVEDVAIIAEAMAGHDPKDATTVADAVPAYSKELENGAKKLRIGIPDEYLKVEGVQPEVIDNFEASIKKLEALGHTIEPVSLPHTKYGIAVYYILVPSEVSSNLARLDGIRYGSQSEHESLEQAYTHSRRDGFPEEVKRRMMIGTYALSAGYYDAYYRKAQKVRTLICRDFTNAFSQVDLIVTPTSPFPAFKIGEKADDPLAMYLADALVCPSAIAGIPGLSVPSGITKDGLPLGLQILGPRMEDLRVLQLGHQFETNV